MEMCGINSDKKQTIKRRVISAFFVVYGMWLLVMIGFVLDYCLVEMGHTVNIDIGFNCLVSVAVVFWLLANEIISILENISDIGTPLPPFLLKLVEYMREKTEISGNIQKEEQYGDDMT